MTAMTLVAVVKPDRELFGRIDGSAVHLVADWIATEISGLVNA